MNEKFYLIKQSELNEDLLKEIIFLKNQYWVHPYESQKRWINENLENDDLHLLMKIDEKPVAYLSICRIAITIDENKSDMLGIGSVCVGREYAKKGFGKAIVLKANDIIKEKNAQGVLLCHDALIEFYRRCGWNLINYNAATLASQNYSDNVMLLNGSEINAVNIQIEKNF